MLSLNGVEGGGKNVHGWARHTAAKTTLGTRLEALKLRVILPAVPALHAFYPFSPALCSCRTLVCLAQNHKHLKLKAKYHAFSLFSELVKLLILKRRDWLNRWFLVSDWRWTISMSVCFDFSPTAPGDHTPAFFSCKKVLPSFAQLGTNVSKTLTRGKRATACSVFATCPHSVKYLHGSYPSQ